MLCEVQESKDICVALKVVIDGFKRKLKRAIGEIPNVFKIDVTL